MNNYEKNNVSQTVESEGYNKDRITAWAKYNYDQLGMNYWISISSNDKSQLTYNEL